MDHEDKVVNPGSLSILVHISVMELFFSSCQTLPFMDFFFINCVMSKQTVNLEIYPWTFLHFQKKHSKQDRGANVLTELTTNFNCAVGFGIAFSSTCIYIPV